MLCLQCNELPADPLRVNRGASCICVECARANQKVRKAENTHINVERQVVRPASRCNGYNNATRTSIEDALERIKGYDL